MNTTAQILAETFEKSRELNRWYLGKLKGQDMNRSFFAGDVPLNSAYWITAHLVWAENSLLLLATGHPGSGHLWLNDYAIGSKVEAGVQRPFEEVLEVMKEVHALAMAHVPKLSEEVLNEENKLGFGFGNDRSIRMILMHAIRHESTHTGHLSWLCKLYGVPTV